MSLAWLQGTFKPCESTISTSPYTLAYRPSQSLLHEADPIRDGQRRWVIGLCVVLVLGEGKLVQKQMYFRSNSAWQYLTKFGMSVGKGEIETRVRFRTPLTSLIGEQAPDLAYPLSIGIYLDTKWQKALDEPNCTHKLHYRAVEEMLLIPANGSWSETFSSHLGQRTRPFVWFVAVSDCALLFHEANPNWPAVEIESHLTGVDGGEFSHEDIGLLTIHSLALALYVLILAYCGFSYWKEMKITDRIDSPILLLLIGIVLEFMALLFEWIHLLSYSSNGQGIMGFHVLSLIAEVASEFFLSLLFLLLSWGWTVTYLEFGDIEIYIPLVGLLLIGHLLIAGATQITNDAYHKYHDFEGIQGLLLVLARIGMFVYFLFGMRDTYTACRTKAKPFLKTLGQYGSTYMLSFPVLVIICLLCPPYVRHKVIVVGTILVQSLTMAILMRTFTGKTSYTAVAKQLGPALPGGKND